MASKTPYDLMLPKLQSILEPTIPVVEWESLTQNMEQRDSAFVGLEGDNQSDDRIVSVGSPSSNHMRETGEFTLHIFTPAYEGYTPTRDIAETLRTQLRFQDLTSGVYLEAVSPPATGLIADGLWSSMLLNVEYRYEYNAPTYVT